MRLYRAAILACAISFSGTAWANTTPAQTAMMAPANPAVVESFTVGSAQFVFPVPSGYCLPKGRYETVAKVAAQMDTRNMTAVSYVSCIDMEKGVEQTRWGALKAMIATVNGGAGPRKDLVEGFKSQINPADLQKLNQQGADEAAGNIERGLGQKFDIKIDLKPLDADDAAAYAGGTLTFQKADGNPIPISCVYAATIVKDRVFFVYLFSVNSSAREVTALLAELKLATHAFVEANPEGK